MTPRELMAAFEVVADAPDGVKRLRELVLSLAVRGKLVAQDPADEPANAALFEVRAYANARGGRVSAAQVEPKWQTPPTWAWVPFGVTHLNRDAERIPLSREERAPRQGSYDYYGASGVIDRIDAYLFDKTLLLVGEDGANLVLRSTPIAFLARGKYWVNNHAHVLDAPHEITLRYLAIFLNGVDLRPYLTGTAQPKLNQAKMNAIPCPFPPLAEQHRIVARVDELMALLDRLESAHKARDEARRAARDAALAALRDAEDADAVETAWARIAGEMGELFTNTDDVNGLREMVRLLAVRGRLVKTDDEVEYPGRPFAIPREWRWCQISDVTEFVTSGSRNWNQYYSDAGANFIRSQDIKLDKLEYDDRAYVQPPPAAEGTRTKVKTGDWLITITGANVGKCAWIDADPHEAYVSQHVALVRPIDTRLGRFGHIWLTAAYGGRGLLLSDSYGAKPGLNLNQIRALPIPIPPLPEQHRIVAKVDALLALCDTLEARLRATRELHAQLAAAAVHHLDV